MIPSTLATSSSGNFLVSPNVGVMIWTLVAFGITVVLLSRLVFPRISEALAKRQKAIEESIDSAQRTREEAETLLGEYRERLRVIQPRRTSVRSRSRAVWLQRRPRPALNGTSRRPLHVRSLTCAMR
jgi:F-type H+-transporting ATPase subunit b